MSVIKYRDPSNNGAWTTLTNVNVTQIPVVLAPGNSTTSVMSLKAITDYISNISTDKIKDTVTASTNLSELLDTTGLIGLDYINELLALGINESISKNDVDTTNKLLKITSGNTRYAIPVTELVTPSAPTVPNTSYSIVTGDASVAILNNLSGSTIKYSLNSGSTWDTGTTVTIASGFANNLDNETFTLSLWAKAVLNGEESNITKVTITITPKVAKGSVSITMSDGNYSTSATTTITPSTTKNAKSEYKIGSGNWTEFSEETTLPSITPSSSPQTISAGYIQVRATKDDYADSDIAQSSAFTFNKKKFWYGFGGATLANEAAIKALGNSLNQDTMLGTYSATCTTAGTYIWFCGSGTISASQAVKSSGFDVPMESVTVVDGYNCYRLSSAVLEVKNYTFNIVNNN